MGKQDGLAVERLVLGLGGFPGGFHSGAIIAAIRRQDKVRRPRERAP